MYYLAKAATTKYHRLGSLSNKNVFSHSYKACNSKIKVLQIDSSEPFLLGLWMATFLLCPLTGLFSMHMQP